MTGRIPFWTRLAIALAACAVFASPAFPPASDAAYPGKNGRLLFGVPCNLFTVNPDGSDIRQVTFEEDCALQSAAWSPDGTRIAYEYRIAYDFGNEIYVVNADGTGKLNITEDPVVSRHPPSWSPDGTRIAHERWEGNYSHIWIMDADGTDAARLPVSMCSERDAVWRADGRIAFLGSTTLNGTTCLDYKKWLVDPDGSNLAPLPPVESWQEWSPDLSHVVFDRGCAAGQCDGMYTQPGDASAPPTEILDGTAFDASWSPDGTKIAFRGRRVPDSSPGLYTMNPDGSGVTRVAAIGTALRTGWQPIPVNSYPRPKAASSVETSLVPAYSPCASPNRTHGPPLAFGSCNPPVEASGEVTLGTPDANGKPVKGEGKVTFGVAAGDVQIALDLRDVYDEGVLADYTGELRMRSGLRITDKRNQPHPGGPGAGTVSDNELGATVPCTATGDPAVGASCALVTTANAIAPGTVVPGARSVWELGQVHVDDGGADGDADTAGDNTLFMVQGVFVP